MFLPKNPPNSSSNPKLRNSETITRTPKYLMSARNKEWLRRGARLQFPARFLGKIRGRACRPRSRHDNASSFHGLGFPTIGEPEAPFVGVRLRGVATFTGAPSDHQHVPTDLKHVLRTFARPAYVQTSDGATVAREVDCQGHVVPRGVRFHVRLVFRENFMSFGRIPWILEFRESRTFFLTAFNRLPLNSAETR